MRKYIHPLLKETIIQTKNGALYFKRWLYFRKFLPLEIDYTTNIRWKKSKVETKAHSEIKIKNKEVKKIT